MPSDCKSLLDVWEQPHLTIQSFIPDFSAALLRLLKAPIYSEFI